MYRLLQDAFKRSRQQSDGKTFVPMQQNVNRVFTPEQETYIEEYAIKIAKMFYGLPIKEFLGLAYEYAEACNISNIPAVWVAKGMATRDWYYAFMSRHPKLTLKAPEGMSIARAMAFNRVNVEVFFKAYCEAKARYEFSPDRIFNMDESGLSTVMKPMKVLCQKGRPVAKQQPSERGLHMTFVGFVNAAGGTIPPVFIIARRRANPQFMRGTTEGSIALYSHNGWMTGELFLETLKHLREKTYCSVDNKILLIMDNAECHMNIQAVEYAIQNGIVIVTLPPHTTAKLQPLDVSMYGPFKNCLKAIQDDFKLTSPNVPITEFMLPEFACKAWYKVCSPSNIMSGFAATGIYPVNRNIFPDDAFLGAEVSERDLALQEEQDQTFPAEGGNQALDPNLQAESPSSPGVAADVGVSDELRTPVRPGPSSEAGPSPEAGPSSGAGPPSVTPEAVRPYPKGPPRKMGKGRRSVKACILTEDEGALALLREKDDKKKKAEERKEAALERRKDVAWKRKSSQKKDTTRAKRSRAKESSSEEEAVDDPVVPVYDDSSEYSDEVDEDAPAHVPYAFQEKEPQVRNLFV